MENSTKKWIGLAATVLVIIGAIVVATFAGGLGRVRTIVETAPEAVEAVVSNAERELREPLRPIRGTDRLLVFAIDGLGRDEMRELIANGSAPHTAAFIGAGSEAAGVYERGYLADDTLSVLPSSTIAAWSTIFTGSLPARTGIPGNEFFLRETAEFYAIAPTSVPSREHALQAVNDGLLNDLLKTPTLYEQADLRAHVSMSQVYRGADVYTISESALLDFIVSTTKNAATTDEEVEQSKYEALDSESFDALQDAISEHGVPDIQTVYLPGLDLFSHASSNSLDKQAIYFHEVIDPIVGKVLAEYERAGVLDDTWVVFISDHGHTPVVADPSRAIEVDDLEGALTSAGHSLRPPLLEFDAKDRTAVLASQGGFGYLYLANRGQCDGDDGCDWTAAPRWNEDVLPAVEAIATLNREPDGLDGCIDAILTRDPAETEASFEVWEGGRLHPVDEWLSSHPLENQLALAQRLRDLTEGPYGGRVGEIVMLAHLGMHYPKEERCYFSQPVESEHGSATPEDSEFTLLVARRGKSGKQIKATVSKISGERPHQKHFVPLAMRLLGLSPSSTTARVP